MLLLMTNWSVYFFVFKKCNFKALTSDTERLYLWFWHNTCNAFQIWRLNLPMLHVTHFLAIKKAIAYQFVGIYPYDWEVMPFIFNKLLKGYTYGGNAFQMQSHYQFQCLPNAFFQQQCGIPIRRKNIFFLIVIKTSK